MIFSVPTSRCTYVYREGPGSFPATGRFREPRGKPINGMYPPEAFAASLPGGTTVKGEGKEAVGIIVVQRGVFGAVSESAKRFGLDVGAGLIVAFLAHKLWRR